MRNRHWTIGDGGRRRLNQMSGRASPVVVDADTQEILGAAILGVGGDEAVHGILGYHVCQGALHDASACRAHTSNRFGAHSHHPG